MQRDTSAAGANYRELRAEFNRWKIEVDKLRDWSDQDVEEIRQAFCRAPDAGDYKEVNAVAERWASKLRDQWGVVMGQAERIKVRAQELIGKKRALKNGPKVITGVDAIVESITKLKDKQLAGSNNPMLKARADYGVVEHKNRQQRCEASEVPISSTYCDNPHPDRGDCSIDCVNVSNETCVIVEIKPKGQESLGRAQHDAYRNAIDKMFSQHGSAKFDGKLAIFRKCVSADGKSIKLDVKLDTYEFCPKPEDIGPRVENVRVDIPEDEE
ncbi:MAG: hypothetical protein HS111_10360 [Kofleriaceae bacterium]|nr:hypothetical protein [Kofleriaceae bacterium]